MKNTIKFLILTQIVSFFATATNYYVSPTGNDANPGTLAQPWRTMAKVSTYQASLADGDQVLFERGGTFRGTIAIGKAGSTPTSRIMYGAYGSGAKPKLLGSTTLGGWTNTGSDVWQMSPGQLIGELFMNDKRQTVARFPNKSYLPIDNFSGNQLTNSILGLGAWNSANVYVRRQNDWIVKGTVNAQSGNTIDVTIPNGGSQISAGKGFFVDGVASAMDLAGEWYQEKNAPYNIFIKMPNGLNPNTQTFEGSILDYGFYTGGYINNLLYENLDLRYYKKRGISSGNCSSITVQFCNFKNIGEKGIYLQGQASGTPSANPTGDILIDSCTFYDINSEAINIEWFKNSTVKRNVAKRIGIRAGYEFDDLNSAIGFYIHHIYNVTVFENKIDSTGYSCMVWNGENNIIERNEMSNNGLTKNDNGFIQAWGGKTKFNIVRDNILHDGFGSEDGMPGHDWTKNDIGAAEGIYFDSFTHSNTITGNTIYNSKNGLFVQSSQNYTISNNTTYNCYWNGLMHHEFNPTDSQNPCNHDCSWSADIVNIKTFNNIFYSVRPDQNGIRWSSDRCNSPFNFGTSDNNYIFNPYKSTLFSQYAENCPGSVQSIYTLPQWRTLRNKELNSKGTDFAWSPYFISTTGASLVSNGTFDSDINGWGGNGPGNTIWETNPLLNGGAIKGSQTGGGMCEIQSPAFSVTAGKVYVANFSIVGNRNGNIQPFVLRKWPVYSNFYPSPAQNFQFSTQKATYQLVFTAQGNFNDMGFHFNMQANGDIVWIDDVSILEVTSIQPDAYLDRSKLFVNNETASKSFNLGTNVYKDLDGNYVCGSITLGPYKSKILILQDNFVSSVSVLGNNTAICSGQKAILTVIGANSGIQWQQSGNNSAWTSITGATMAIYTTVGLSANTYFRVAYTNTACGTNVSYSNAVLITINGVSPTITGFENPICQGQKAVLSILGVDGSTFNWQNSNNGGSVWSAAPGINNANTYTYIGANFSSMLFSVLINGTCGFSVTSPVQLNITSNSNPAFSYWPTCNNQTLSQNNGFNNASIGFYSTTSLGISVNSVSGSIYPTSVTGNIQVRFTKYANGGCPLSITTTSLFINPPPTISFQPGLTFCANIPFVITASGASELRWALNGFPQSTVADIKTLPGIYNYSLTAYDNLGTQCRNNFGLAVVTILGNPLPTITGGAALTYCQFANANATDITNKVSGSSLRWYNVSVSGPFNTTTGAPATGTAGTPAYSLWVSNNNGTCESPRLKFDININPTSISNINPVGAASFCAGGNVVLTSTSAINNQWYKNGQTITGANTRFLTVSTAGIYNLKVGSGLCTDTVSVGTKVSITPLPSVNLAVFPASQSVCTGAGASVSVANSEAGVVYQAFSGANAISNTLLGTGNNLSITIPSANLTVGGNSISVKATAFAANVSGANALFSSSLPIIDGNLTESGWNLSKSISKCVNDVCPGNNTATFGTLWDANYLYVGVKVVDASVIFDPTKQFWDTDAIEIFVDGDNIRNPADGSYDSNTKQYILRYGDPNDVVLEKSTWIPVTVSGSGVIFKSKLTNDGYTMEVAIPWARIGVSAPSVGSAIGFDVGYDDNDGGINRYSQVVYAGFNNNAWDNRQFGDLAILGSQTYCAGTVNLTTSSLITVNPSPQNPIFNYGNNIICNSNGLVNNTFSGTGGGTFLATNGLNINTLSGAISVTGFAGVSTITYFTSPSGGCGSVSGWVVVTVNSAPIAPSFSYGNTPFCASQSTISIFTSTGIINGSFSATNGFNVNSISGLITVNSLAGVSTITYTIPSTNGCGSVSGFATVTVNSAPIAPSFSYGNTPFCASQSTISIFTSTGIINGSFSATNGFNVNSISGLITVNSLAGVSTITYTIPSTNGCGSVSGFATVTVNSAPIAPSFSYGNAPFCASQSTISIFTSTGIINGSFSATNGFNVNSVSGLITVNSLAGVSTITYTIPSANGCGSVSGMATVTVNSAPTAPNFSYGNAPFCTSQSTISIFTSTGITNGSFSATNGFNVNSVSGLITVNSLAGVSTITYTIPSANGCGSVSGLATVTVNSAPTAPSFGYGNAPFCASQSTISIFTSTGIINGSFSATNGFNVNSVSGLIIVNSLAGVSTITYTIPSANGCGSVSGMATVTVNSAPTAPSFSYGNAPFCSSQSTISIFTSTGIINGSFSATNGFNVNSVSGLITVNSLAGVSTITYTIPSANGCGSVSGLATVTVNSAPIAPSFSYGNAPFCTSQSTISIFTSTGITNGSFSATNGFNVNSVSGLITVNSLAGVSTITYTIPSANGCGSVSGLATITTAGFALAGTISGGNSVVTVNGNSGSMLIVGHNGAITGWERNINNSGWVSIPSTTNANPFSEDVNSIGITAYRVGVTNGICGNAFSISKSISVSGVGGYVTGSINQVCEGNPIQNLTLLGAVGTKTWMYSLNNGQYVALANSTTLLSSFTPTSVGIYSFAVSILGTGLSSAYTITVSAPPTTPSFSYGNAPFCSSQSTISIFTSNGITGGSFTATNGFNVNSISGLINVNSLSGISTITYTIPAAYGCGWASNSATITVNSAPNTPNFSYGNSTYCSNQSTITLVSSTGIANGSFSATNGFNVNSISGLITVNSLSGTSTITYLIPTSGGCSSVSGFATVTVDGLNAIPNLTYANSICQSASILNPTTTFPVNSIFSYSTSGINILSINTNTGVITPNLSSIGGYNITIIVPTANACPSVSASTNLNINADDVASFSYPSATICNLSSGVVLPITIGQTTGGAYTYSTSGSDMLSINGVNGEITPSASQVGNYVIQYQTSGICATSAYFTMTVGTNPLTANFSFPGFAFCSQGVNPQATGTIQTLSVVSSTGTGSLVWVDQTQGIVNALASGNNQTYRIKNMVSITGCGTDTKYADIAINANPNVSILGSAPSICIGKSVTLSGMGAASYDWSNNVTGNTNTLTPSITSTLTLTGTSDNCSSVAMFTVTVNSLPNVQISTSKTTLCDGETLTLGGSGAITYQWYPFSSTNTTLGTQLSSNQVVSLTGTDANSCQSTSMVSITVNSIPVPPIGTSPNPVCLNDPSVTLTAIGQNLKWYDTSSGGFGTSTAPIVTTNNPSTVTSYISQTINNCESSDRLMLNAIVKSKPMVNISSSVDFLCFQNRYTIDVNTTATGNLNNNKWFVNNSLINITTNTLDDNNYELPSGVNTIKLIAIPTETCGTITTIASNVVVVTVNSRPLQPNFSIPNNIVCSDIGTINWSSTSNLATATWIITPTNAGVNASANDGINIANNSTGFYNIIAINRSGNCPPAMSTFTGLTINPKPSLPTGLAYDSNKFCADRVINASIINTSLTSGFSTSALDLVVDANGAIQFPTNFIGTATITYTKTLTGCSSISTTIGITIDKPVSLSGISYSKTQFCKEGSQSVSISGENTGKFYAQAGLAINQNNGDINLENSNKGNYQIVYTISGNGACDGKSATNSVTILEPSNITITAANFNNEGICEQNAVNILVSSSQNDSIVWYQKSPLGIDWAKSTNLSLNKQLFTSEKLSETWVYKAIGLLKDCPNLIKTSNEITANVSLQSKVGKAVTTKPEVCPDEPSTQVLLENYRGTIQWYEASKADTSVFKSINPTAQPKAQTDNLSTPDDFLFNNIKYYKAKVKNGPCPAVISNTIEIKSCQQNNFVPNALTPNTGDKNSYWDLSTLKLSDFATINVFNRYGSPIVELNGKAIKTNPWDGSGLPAGTYYYTIDRKDGSKPLSGDITLIK